MPFQISFLEKASNVIQSVDFIENMKEMERFDEISKEFLDMKAMLRFEASATRKVSIKTVT